RSRPLPRRWRGRRFVVGGRRPAHRPHGVRGQRQTRLSPGRHVTIPLTTALRAARRDALEAARSLRRRLHAAPRVSGDEADTTAQVVDALGAGPGLEIAGTGRVVLVGTGTPARGCIALRAELDALPVTETTGVSWAATGDAMHACGHDVHLAASVAVWRASARGHSPVSVAA